MVESETAAYSVTSFPTLLGCCRALPLRMPLLKSHVALWLCRSKRLRADYLTFPYVLYIYTEIYLNILEPVKACLCNFVISFGECFGLYLISFRKDLHPKMTDICDWTTTNDVTSGQLLKEPNFGPCANPIVSKAKLHYCMNALVFNWVISPNVHYILVNAEYHKLWYLVIQTAATWTQIRHVSDFKAWMKSKPLMKRTNSWKSLSLLNALLMSHCKLIVSLSDSHRLWIC